MRSSTRCGGSRRWMLAAAAAVVATACDRSPPPTSEEMVRNATYLSEWSEDGVISLADGEFSAPAPPGSDPEVVISLVDFATGDLDGDGSEDAAVVLVERLDELRAFYRLHALLRDGRDLQDVSTRLLGDDVTIEAVHIEDGVIKTDLLLDRLSVPAAAEPRGGTPPSAVTRDYVLTTRGLLPASIPAGFDDAADIGLSGDAVSSLTGEAWAITGIHTDQAQTVPDAGEERPELSFVEELRSEDGASGRLFGSTGCNRLLGSYQATNAGGIRLSGLATTRKMCGRAYMEFEQLLSLSLGSALGFEVEGDQLQIRFAGGVLSASRATGGAP